MLTHKHTHTYMLAHMHAHTHVHAHTCRRESDVTPHPMLLHGNVDTTVIKSDFANYTTTQ